MKIKSNKFNINIFLKIISLLGFAFFYLITIFTGSVKQYVHPRIIPYMIFASIVMVIIAVLLLGELFKKQKVKIKSLSLLFYIIPLIMAFALPAKTFDSNAGAMGNLELSDKQNTSENLGEASSNLQDEKEDSQNSIANSGITLQNGVIVMDSSNFYKCVVEIYENMDKYEGVSIEVIGFVFNDSEELSDNEFVPSRYMMSCCAADMVPIGLLCRYEKAQELQADTWVKVTGKIIKAQYQGSDIPVIQATSVDITEKPKDDYVYPY